MNKVNKNSKSIWIYGIHAVNAVFKNPKREILRFIIADKSQLIDFSVDKSMQPELVGKQYFIDLFGKEAIHQGVAVLVNRKYDVFIEDILKEDDDRPVIILDQITDPHNIGAILRSAAVFDAKCLIVTENNSPAETSVLAKTASGALEIVPIIRVVNLSQCMKLLKKNGYWCVGLDERGTDYLNNINLLGKYAFVIGSEGYGMRRLTKESCDILAKLPVSNSFSTLNAAQACTVTLYESFIQRTKK